MKHKRIIRSDLVRLYSCILCFLNLLSPFSSLISLKEGNMSLMRNTETPGDTSLCYISNSFGSVLHVPVLHFPLVSFLINILLNVTRGDVYRHK